MLFRSALYRLAWIYTLIMACSLSVVLFASWMLARGLSGFALRLEHVLDEKNAILRAQLAEIERISVTDELTGIANRRSLDGCLANELLRARRGGRPFSVIMFDVDRFKDINDRHGHAYGDKALMSLAAIAQKTVRATDTVGRWEIGRASCRERV